MKHLGRLRVLTPALALGALVACGSGHDHDGHSHGADGHTHGDGEHEHPHEEGDQAHAGEGEHGHDPVYGGLLVELGDHVAHVELVHDPEEGRLTLYSMDAHAEQAERLAAESIEVTLDSPDGSWAVNLLPETSALTGETVGDSAAFSAVDPRLEGLEAVSGRISVVETRGQRFEDVLFPAGE